MNGEVLIDSGSGSGSKTGDALSYAVEDRLKRGDVGDLIFALLGCGRGKERCIAGGRKNAIQRKSHISEVRIVVSGE